MLQQALRTSERPVESQIPLPVWIRVPAGAPRPVEEEEEHTFETADSGASATYPQQAGEIRKGSFLMIKGRPCKCVEVSTSKTGKHGHAKAHIVALDIFTNKKYEDLCPTSHNLEVPFVKKTEMQVCHADPDSGECHMMLDDQGNMKEDLFLPSHPQDSQVTPSDEDNKIAKEILEGVENGKKVLAIVQAACGMEKIIGHKTTDS